MAHDWTTIEITGAVPEYKTLDRIACDDDGSVMLVGLEEGRLYLSTDRGDTWTEKQPAGDVDQNWRGLAVDSDGSVLFAAARGGRLWLSTNGGTSWTEPRPKGDTYGLWQCVACDSDGSVLIACENSGRLYVSTNGGSSWTERQPAGAADKSWYCCAADSDGSVLLAGVLSGRLYRSTDSGANWSEIQPAGDTNARWISVDCDSDGSVLLAGTNFDGLYLSTDSGANWSAKETDIDPTWAAVMVSADGTKMAALPGGGNTIRYSEDSGASWSAIEPSASEAPYWAVGCSDSDLSVILAGGWNWTVSRNRIYLGLTGCPVLSFVNPLAAGGTVTGLTPNLTFGIANDDAATVHIELQVSDDPAFGSYDINSDSASDYASWEVAASPYTTWTTMLSSGAPAGNQARYPVTSALRYDVYFCRAQLDDGTHRSGVYRFTFTVVAESDAPLVVVIGTTTYNVTACTIAEEIGGEASTIDLEIPLSDYLANPIAKGDPIAISSGLGGGRTWNGTVEARGFSGSVVRIHGLQDDAYLSRKLATGDLSSADLGANLIELVETYGSPLTAFNINAYVGIDGAITGGYKYLREHFSDALKQLPNYLYWVDETGDVHFIDQDDLPEATFTLYEEDPSA